MVLSYLLTVLWFTLILSYINCSKPAVIFTLGIFLVFIVPFIQPFIGLIPDWEKNSKSLKYIPFSYLTEKSQTDSIKFSNWQWFISLASIVILFIANIAYATKRIYNICQEIDIQKRVVKQILFYYPLTIYTFIALTY